MARIKNTTRRKKINGTPIYAGRRVIGEVLGDTFYKSIAKNHYLRQPPAIAVDVDSLHQAERAGATWTEITDREDGTIYRATIQQLLEKGKAFDRGFGLQVFLPLEAWIHRSGEGTQLTLFG